MACVQFLGHLVSGDGINVEQHKLQAIRDGPRPKTLRELQAFIGLANYYRQFVAGFALTAAPLHDKVKRLKS